MTLTTVWRSVLESIKPHVVSKLGVGGVWFEIIVKANVESDHREVCPHLSPLPAPAF